VSIAEAAGIHDVLVMPYAPVFSAYGASTVDIVHRHETLKPADGKPDPQPGLREAVLRDMRGEGYHADMVQLETAQHTRDGVSYVSVEGRYSLPRATSAVSTVDDVAASGTETGSAEVFWDGHGVVTTTIVDRRRAPLGFEAVGPALIDGAASTCVVPPGWTLTIDERGAFRLRRTDSGKDRA
jgi:N-methylhydantoinase A/oxoprolinase/acetone carboxylase beta subunit